MSTNLNYKDNRNRRLSIKKTRTSLEQALLLRKKFDDDLSVPLLREADLYRDRTSNNLN